MGLSKLSEECKNCPFVSRCKHKRMEALAYMTETQVLANAADPSFENLAAPLLRETMTIMVNGTPRRNRKTDLFPVIFRVRLEIRKLKKEKVYE